MEYDSILKQNIYHYEKRRDPFDEDIINAILEKEQPDFDDKPLKVLSSSLRGYVKDLHKLQKESTPLK